MKSTSLVVTQRLLRALTNDLPAYEVPAPPQAVAPQEPPTRKVAATPADEPPVRGFDDLDIDPRLAERFHNYAPTWHTKIGPVTSTLTGLRNVEGEVIGEYSLVVRDRVDRTVETTRYFYAYRHDRFVKVGEMPSTVREM